MVEIALSIGIVAFALVAILGVLPTGMKVKKDNREDVIINEDGAFLMEAIRSGSRAVDELTNFVEEITQDVSRSNIISQAVQPLTPFVLTNFTSNLELSGGGRIIGLLSQPRYLPFSPQEVIVSKPTARIRAITGSALEKGKANRDFSFRYLLTSEVIPFTMAPPILRTSTNEFLQQLAMTNNLYEVRLTLQWPLFPKGAKWDVGRNRKTFRTLVGGRLEPMRDPASTNVFYFFKPNVFTNLNATL